MNYAKTLSCAALTLFSISSYAVELKLATGNDYAPYADEKLTNGGLAATLINAIYAGSDTQVKFIFLPWARSLDETFNLTYDASFPWLKNPERLEKFNYTEPLITINQKVFTSMKNKEQLKTIDDLKAKKMCLPIGWALADATVETMVKNKEITVIAPKDISSCAQMVASDHADFFISDDYQGKETIASTNLSASLGSTFIVSSSDLYVIVSKKNPNSEKFISEFNQKIQDLKKSGKYEEITNAYLKH